MAQIAHIDLLSHMTDAYSFASIDNICMITVTLSPKLYKYKSFTQYEITINELRKLCDNQTERYVFTPEVTQAGNIHYHVLCRFNTRLQKITMINKLKGNKLFGFSKISNPCDNYERVNTTLAYILKDTSMTQKVLTAGSYRARIINSSYLSNDDILGKYEEICQTPEQKAIIQKALQEINQPCPQVTQSEDA